MDEPGRQLISLPEANLAALRMLIAGVCHEINNPLTAVQGLADLLAQEATDPQSREDLEMITQESARAIGVIRNLRAFAREPEGPLTPCSVNDALARVIEARGYETRARGLLLDTDLMEDLPPVDSRPEDLMLLGLLLLLDGERLALERPPAHDQTVDAHGMCPAASQLTYRTSTDDGWVRVELEVQGARVSPDAAVVRSCAELMASAGASVGTSTAAEDCVVYSVLLPAAS